MRILVTNDDGVDSDGVWVLAATLAADGHEVVVVAPDAECSGAGAALGHVFPGQKIRVHRADPRCDFEGEAWAVAGMPALCAILAQCSGAFGPPFDACVAGINPGFNTGGLIMHSGTVGAALTAANTGIPAIAVSIGAAQVDPTRAPGDQVGQVHLTGTYHWATAARLAADALAWLVAQPQPERLGPVLNINVPNAAPADLLGVRVAPLGRFPFGAGGGQQLDPSATSIRFGLGWGGPPAAAHRARPAVSDTALVAEGWVTATSLHPVREGADLDVTAALAAGLAALPL